MDRTFIWNRHRYVIGAADVASGKVMECHTEKQLAVWDYHRDFAFSYEQSSAMNTGESLEFCLDDKGKIVFDPYDVEEYKFNTKTLKWIKDKIMEQIKIAK